VTPKDTQQTESLPPEDAQQTESLPVEDTQQTESLPKVPNVQFRVLVIGKANAGKTSILQRVCDTTESPEVYSVDSSGARNRVRSVLDPSGTFELIVLPGSTRPYNRG
jgi:GTPase SAR1 family protein